MQRQVVYAGRQAELKGGRRAKRDGEKK